MNVIDHGDEHDADNQCFVSDSPVMVAFEWQMKATQITTENTESNAAQIQFEEISKGTGRDATEQVEDNGA